MMIARSAVLLGACGGVMLALACGGGESGSGESAALADRAAVVIATPDDGDTLSTANVTIALLANGVDIRPAGTNEPGTGHHHLFIDRILTPVGQAIPTEPGIVHLGAAQTEYTLEGLAPGEHTIIAVIGDYLHVRLGDVATDTVRIVVAPTS